MSDKPIMLSATDVAQRLGISARKVYALAASGELAHYKFGGCVRFEPADVEAYAPSPQLVPARVLREYERLRLRIPSERRPESRLTPEQRAIAEKRQRRERMTPWADSKAIRAIYAEAQRLTRDTGIPHHVDHIIPLQGEFVSGLHVHNNLQILTGSENSKKHNRFEVEV